MEKVELLGAVITQLMLEKERLEKQFEEIHRAAVEAPSAMQSHSDTTNAIK
jgi:hypothetical protein